MTTDMARVRTIWKTGPQGGGVSTHFFATNTLTVVAAQALVDRVRDFWAALKPSILSDGTWDVSGVVDYFDSFTGALQTSLTATTRSDGGSAAGIRLPPATQALVRWETGQVLNGKRVRGRTFIPNLVTGVSNGGPTGTLLTNVPSAVTAINLAATDALVVWHRPAHPGPTGTGGHMYAAISGALQPKFAVLRSRRD